MACVGVNGEGNLGFDLSKGTQQFTYFTAPAGHTFIWRLFTEREEAHNFLAKLTMNDKKALEWVESMPLDNAADLEGLPLGEDGKSRSREGSPGASGEARLRGCVCGVARGEARSGRSGDAPAEDRLSLARKMDRVLAPRFRLAATPG